MQTHTNTLKHAHTHTQMRQAHKNKQDTHNKHTPGALELHHASQDRASKLPSLAAVVRSQRLGVDERVLLERKSAWADKGMGICKFSYTRALWS